MVRKMWLPNTTDQKYDIKLRINIMEIILFMYTILILLVYLLPSFKYNVSYPVSAMLLLMIVPYSFIKKPKLRKYIIGIFICAFITWVLDIHLFDTIGDLNHYF